MASQEVLLLDRLRGESGIDARGAEEDESVNICLLGRVHHIHLDTEVVREEFGGEAVVRQDATHACSGQNHVSRTHGTEEVEDGLTLTQVELGRCPSHELAVSCLLYTSPSPRDGLL